MEQQHRTVRAVESDGLLHDFLGLGGASQPEENPRLGVEVGGFVVRERRHAARHDEGLLQIAPLLGQEVGVVVEHQDVVRPVAEALFVGGEALARHAGLVVGVADEAPDGTAQRVARDVAQRLAVGLHGPLVVFGVAQGVAPEDAEVGVIGEERDGLRDVLLHRVGALEVVLDFGHGAEVALHRGPVGRAELVEGEGLLQLARGNQVVGIEAYDARVVRMADDERRGQAVDLCVVFAVEAQVGGELPEAADHLVDGEGVGLEDAARGGEQPRIVVPRVVEVGQRHERLHVGRVNFQRTVELRAGERIVALQPVEVGQYRVVFRLVGNLLGHGARLVDRLVELARGDEQLPLHGREHGRASEAHLGAVERRQGRVGALDLFVERRHKAVVVRLARVVAQQAAEDVECIAVALGIDERLAVEASVPLVGRVRTVGPSGQRDRLVVRVVHPVGRQRVAGRGAGRVAAQRLVAERAGAGRVAVDEQPLQRVGVEVEAAQRVGRHDAACRGRPAACGGEQPRKHAHAQKQGCRQSSHGLLALLGCVATPQSAVSN